LVPPVISCGACVACRTGRENVCERMRMFGNHMDGAFAEYVIVPRKDLVVLPEDLPLEEACVIADAVATPFHAVVRRGGVAPGDRVAVVGVGGVGVNAVQIAAAVGARVVALDLDERRLARARELGAEEVVRADDPKEASKRVRAWSQGGVPVAFECVGKPETIRLAHSLLRVGGRLVLVGYCEPPAEIAVARIMFFEQEIVGSLGCRPVDFPRVVELVRRGRVRLAPLITARVGLDRVHEAFEHVRRGEGLRAVVVP
jgi:2-desacetyl-2-hydroxyethyl bacteriochlorophyllide A dehydrogenase